MAVFFLGEDLRVHLGYAELPCDHLGCGVSVACTHDNIFNPALSDQLDRPCGFRARRVVYAQNSCKPVAHRKINNGRRAGYFIYARLLFLCYRHALVLADKVAAADDGALAMNRCRYSVCYDVVHLGVLLGVDYAAHFGALNDRARHAVGKMLFDARGGLEHFLLGVIPERDNLVEHGFGVCQRSGLVEHYGVGSREGFEVLSALYGDAVVCRLAQRGDDRDGRGELYCAGIVHHQQ